MRAKLRLGGAGIRDPRKTAAGSVWFLVGQEDEGPKDTVFQQSKRPSVISIPEAAVRVFLLH